MASLLRTARTFWDRHGLQLVPRRTLLGLRRNTTNADIYDWVNDPAFMARYQVARAATGTPADPLHIQRSYVLCEALRMALDAAPADEPLHVAECGVLAGMTAHQLCSILEDLGPDRAPHFHAFDSFEGLSGRTENDVVNRFHPGRSLRSSWIGKWKGVLACPLDTVTRNLAAFDFARFYKGWIPDRFADVADLRFRFVHIDVDLYEPVLASLEFFYPRMTPGGVIVLDDYGYLDWPGAKLATEQFAASHDLAVMRHTTGQAILFRQSSL